MTPGHVSPVTGDPAGTFPLVDPAGRFPLVTLQSGDRLRKCTDGRCRWFCNGDLLNLKPEGGEPLEYFERIAISLDSVWSSIASGVADIQGRWVCTPRSMICGGYIEGCVGIRLSADVCPSMTLQSGDLALHIIEWGIHTPNVPFLCTTV